MDVKNKELFHVVTYNKLNVGQQLEFGKSPNRFCERINSLEFKIGELDLNEFSHKNTLQNLTEDDYKEIGRYIYESCLILREYALEQVRENLYSEKPSRLKCLYACESLEQAETWASILMRMNRLNNLKPLQIIKIKVSGNIFKAEGNLMLRDTKSMNSKLSIAEKYWEGGETFIEPEILVEGHVEVVEIIKEF